MKQKSNKRIIITGANSGIGKAAALQFATKGAEVIIICRNPERGEAAVQDIKKQSGHDNVHLLIGDLSSQVSIRELVKDYSKQFDEFDTLINNAANFDLSLKKPVLTGEGQELIWATNFLGTFLLTNLLLEKMAADGRIINITSRGILAFPFLKIRFEDPGFLSAGKFSPVKAYYHSKLALEVFTAALAEQLAGTGKSVNALRVTNVKVAESRIENQPALLRKIYKLKMKMAWEPEKMAEVYVRLADSEEFTGICGSILDEYGKPVKASKYRSMPEIKEKLLETSRQATGL